MNALTSNVIEQQNSAKWLNSLYNAVYRENIDEAIKLVKQCGPDGTFNGISPLYVASEVGNLNMIKLFINNGIAINTIDSITRSTPLIAAIINNNLRAVECLIQAGADINFSDKYGNLPLDFAGFIKNIEIAKLLVDKGAIFNRVLHVASGSNNIELMKYLITKGADINCKDKIGDTPLHKAADHGMVKLLIEHGAEPDSKNIIDRTPLISAVEKGDVDTVKYLIEAGADLNTQMKDGYSPLHKAILSKNLDIIKLLISNGAKLEIYNNCGETPLAFAKIHGETEIVEYIDSIISNLSHSKVTSIGNTDITIKYNLAADKLDTIETSIKNSIEEFKNTFNVTSDHERKINVYVFNNRDDYENYLTKVKKNIDKDVVGLTQLTNVKKGDGADIYVYLDSRGNLNQHILEHEIGHAMHFTNLGLSNILPKAMHEAIANYVAGLKNNIHVNDDKDIEALYSIKTKNLKADEILSNNYRGEHYYSEAEQVIKFCEDKHPDLIDDLLKALSEQGISRSTGNRLVKDFMQNLKEYNSEFEEWIEEQIIATEIEEQILDNLEICLETVGNTQLNENQEPIALKREERDLQEKHQVENVLIEDSSWSLFKTVKNIINSFFGSIANWFTGNQETETQIDQYVDTEFSKIDKSTILNIEEIQNDHILM
ncbi:ankyrin repeat domain-containing protein [Wolbachia endosymbiont of Tetranychus urticae]|uniref:ankyrin repeat domain-containing protein n=1 Tax=Wolbachia endosymbiont of Tetranychus urticae TaxID=169184 RepID=UPI00397800AF